MAGYSEYRKESRREHYELEVLVYDSPGSNRLEKIVWPRTYISHDFAIDKAVQMVNENPMIREIKVRLVVEMGQTVCEGDGV